MRGYPKIVNSKRDYDNLMSMKEHASRAKSELLSLSSVDDSKVVLEDGSAESSKPVRIDNPSPLWKRLGYKSRADMVSASSTELKGLK